MTELIKNFFKRAEEVNATISSDHEIEIGIDEVKGCLTISEYKPEYAAAFHLEDGMTIDTSKLDLIRDECDKRNWSYVL